MKRIKRMMALLCALVMALTLMAPVQTAYAANDKERQELESALSEAKQKAAEYKKQIEALQNDKNAALEKKMLLDQRNEVLKEQISTAEKQIENTTKAIEEYEVKEQEQYELFCRQTRQEEERGTVSYWSVLFKATSFADLLSRIDFINEVMDYNQTVMADLRAVRAQLAESRTELEEQKRDLDATQKELEADIAEADRIVNEFIATEQGLQAMHDAEKKESDRITEELEKFHQENGDISEGVDDPETMSVLDGMVWPSKTKYITSPFGKRNTGIAGASTNHLGVDIGAPRNSAVYAAQAGKVIQAGWNGGYGYSITISHGEGVTTLYGHLNAYSVRVGDQVTRGQVIGKCGSTGISSGPHIHYEIRINGQHTNPLPYLPGYIAYGW